MFVTVGSLCREASEAARRAGLGEVHHFEGSRKAAEAINDLLRDGDLVVVKGSRRLRLGRVVRAIVGRFGEA